MIKGALTIMGYTYFGLLNKSDVILFTLNKWYTNTSLPN